MALARCPAFRRGRAGQAGLLAINLRGGSAECFSSTAPALRGRDVARSALEALASWAFPVGLSPPLPAALGGEPGIVPGGPEVRF
jgi:hypothetical protein